jgi:hypothetical protein
MIQVTLDMVHVSYVMDMVNVHHCLESLLESLLEMKISQYMVNVPFDMTSVPNYMVKVSEHDTRRPGHDNYHT